MKKIACLILLIIAFGCTVYSQWYITPFKKGQIDINAGVGLVPVLDFEPSLAIDFAVSNNFSIGGMAVLAGKSDFIDQREQLQTTRKYSLALRMAMHYTALKNWDYYGGLMGGYTFNTNDPQKLKDHENLILWTCILGTRFHLNRHLGIFGEFGYNGNSFIRTGINIRI